MIGKSLLRPAGSKPTVCYCAPGQCSAPKPEWCVGKRASEMDAADREAQSRAEAMPTERDAIRVMFAAYQRLKELGWREGQHMPASGERFAGIQSGSTGIHAFTADHHDGTFARPMYYIHDGDLWCSRVPPVLFRQWREDDVQPNLRVCAPIPSDEPASSVSGENAPGDGGMKE